MVVEKTHGEEWEVGLSVKGQRLAQVKKCTYMETTVEHTGHCKTGAAKIINQAKFALWEKATVLRSNIRMKAIDHKINEK